MKKLFLTLAVIVASMSCNAQLLWKVSGNGVKGDSYLFGTHHVAPVDMLDRTPGFNDALKGVDAVYGEIDMAIMNSPVDLVAGHGSCRQHYQQTLHH